MRNVLGKVAACLLFVAAGTTQGLATSGVSLSNEEVLATADSVFLGRVVGAQSRVTGPGGKFIVTDYQIQVERLLADDGSIARDQQGGVVTLTFAGGTVGERGMDVAGLPRLEAGDRAFFFVESADRRSFSPLVGMNQGLYPVVTIDGVERVTRKDGCAAGPGDGAVRVPLMSKLAPARGTGFTADEFAAQIEAALPKVRALPALRRTSVPQMDPSLRGRAFQGNDLPLCQPGSGPVAESASVVLSHAAAVQSPVVAQRQMIEGAEADQTEVVTSSPYQARYGFFRAVPNLPIVYNIPPIIYPAWGNAFEETASNWNAYASDVFRKYTTPNNTLTADNGRSETGFLNNADMIAVYNYPWGATTYAVALGWSVNNRLVESDILFNPAWAWTNDRETAYANSNIVYFQPVSLHEQGHAFGREHSFVTNPGYGAPSVMNYWSRPFYLTETYRVFADDAESIRAAYPGRAVAQNDVLLTMWRMSGTVGANFNGVTDLSFSPTTVQQGSGLTISNMYAENVGTVQRDVSVDFYLCPSQRSFWGAYYAGTSYVANFPRFTVAGYSRSITVPGNVPPGDYYIATALSGGGDVNGFNSQAWSQNRVRVVAPPPPPPSSPPANDMRYNAMWIGQGTYYGNTTYATVDGSAACGTSNSTPDIWYRFVMPYPGTLVADTCDSAYDTVLSLEYSWGGWITCDDDGASCTFRSSRATAALASGEIVYIRVSGFSGDKGAAQLNVRVLLNNDSCAAAAPIGPGTSYGSSVGASASGINANCFDPQTLDIWYSYTAGCTGTVTVDTVGSNFDTVLGTYASCGAAIGECNDDALGTYQSQVSFFAKAGDTTLIRVGGYNGATGNVVLNITAPLTPNDVCENAIVIGDGAVGFDTRCAVTEGLNLSEACGLGAATAVNDVWYSYTSPVNGVASISFCGSDFDVVSAVYDATNGCPANSDPQIVCAALIESCPASASMIFNASAGSTYLIRVGGYYGGPVGLVNGTGGFSINTVPSAPLNDSCDAAQYLTNSPSTYTFSGTLVAATADGSSLSDPVEGAGPDVWFMWDAPCSGVLVAGTCGTYGNYGTNTIISLHSACPGDVGSELTSSSTAAGYACGVADDFDADVALYVAAGQRVMIRIAAEDAAQPLSLISGAISFRPNGDYYFFPTLAAEGSNYFCSHGATPDDIGDGFGLNDVWHVYQAGCTGIATASLCSTPYDTVLAVYDYDGENGAIGAQVAFNYNDGPVCEGIAASLTFRSVAGNWYVLRTGIGFDASLTLDLSCTPDAVPCAADFNQDGGVDGSDVDAFFIAWEAGESNADVNLDGGVDGGDVEAFFALWEAGGC